eukprot:1226335-Rhodomonas_salina.1
MQRQGKKRRGWGWGRRSGDGRLGAVSLIILVACLVLVTFMRQKLGLPSNSSPPLPSPIQLLSAASFHPRFAWQAVSRGEVCAEELSSALLPFFSLGCARL